MRATASAFPPEITADDIMAVVSERFLVSVADLVGGSRGRVLVDARQSAMYLCRELTQLSPSRIGALFGGRDHTTVLHADRKIRALLAERYEVRNRIVEITTQLKLRGR